MFDWNDLMTPQKAILDSMRTLSWFVSYRRLSRQFQFSLSAAALGKYLYGFLLGLSRQVVMVTNSSFCRRLPAPPEE